VPYDQVVFIGYVLDTAPQENIDGTKTYLGIEPPANDIAARCELIKAALETARGALPAPASPPSNTLYVFMLPEFFFRGPTGAYEIAEVQLAIAALQSLAADAKWNDWVFAFGTIIGQWEVEDPDEPIQICNFALVQQGGPAAQGPESARAVVKELMSNIDFIESDATAGGLLLGEVEHPEPAEPGPGSERQKANYDGAGIFDLLGITWAVEICLDHREGRLQASPALPGERQVQFQLVPSCGANVKNSSIMAQTGGYVFNVDGIDEGGAHATLVQSTTPPSRQTPRKTPVTTTQVTLPGSPPTTIPVASLYADGPGSIWTFPPVPIPPARTVPGSTDVYAWRASEAPNRLWILTFYLIYDEAGLIDDVLCSIRNNTIDFRAKKYMLPLSLSLRFPSDNSDPGPKGTIKIDLRPGGNYTNALYVELRIPRYYDSISKQWIAPFNFQGEVMRFMGDKSSAKPVQCIW
jgi:hypothetical protein